MKDEIHKALIDSGFEKTGRYYILNGQRIKIYDNDTLAQIFKRLIGFGETQKVREFKSVMNI
jgi:hypothetical protein